MNWLNNTVDYLSRNWFVSEILLLWTAAVIAGLSGMLSSWRIRRMARQRLAELRKDGFVK